LERRRLRENGKGQKLEVKTPDWSNLEGLLGLTIFESTPSSDKSLLPHVDFIVHWETNGDDMRLVLDDSVQFQEGNIILKRLRIVVPVDNDTPNIPGN